MGSKRARRYRQHSAADKVALLRKVLLEGRRCRRCARSTT
jgi:hypothetical protein